jgi:predicted AlkP superfamily pyrophosphatase or phosphodiesterase
MPLARQQLAMLTLSCLQALAIASTSSAARPHVLFIVGDDVGYNDLGRFNDKKTITPTMDGLLETGVHLASYYTFKIVRISTL